MLSENQFRHGAHYVYSLGQPETSPGETWCPRLSGKSNYGLTEFEDGIEQGELAFQVL